MTATIAREPVTSGLKTMWLAALAGAGAEGRDLYVERGTAPADDQLELDDHGRLIDPYGILYTLPALEFHGSLANAQRAGYLPYQLTCVGRNERSAQEFADLARRVFLDRLASGVYVHPVDAGLGMVVSDRRISETGVAEASNGLWQVVDSYVVAVQAL